MAAPQPTWTTGKRKTAIARVRMFPGSGKFEVNKKSLLDYFGRETLPMIAKQPLEVTETTEQYDISVNVTGGGPSGQAQAIRHGVARALVELDENMREALKKAGHLTRDARKVERKKYGRHKARRSHQFSKR